MLGTLDRANLNHWKIQLPKRRDFRFPNDGQISSQCYMPSSEPFGIYSWNNLSNAGEFSHIQSSPDNDCSHAFGGGFTL